MSHTTLTSLIASLRTSASILHKRDIQTAAERLGQFVTSVEGKPIRLGDDCAAIPHDGGYLLLAAEGLWPQFVSQDPWFAGWCAVMVNLSDIAAMGGEAIAIVDTLWSQSIEKSEPLWAGMQAAASAYGVPIVGGHTNCHSEYDGLAAAVMGRSRQLITSFEAKPGDALIVAIDMDGAYHGDYAFWNAATRKNSGATNSEVTSSEATNSEIADSDKLRKQLALLPKLANSALCSAGKDISMGGLAGTLLMLCEASNCGALLDLNRTPKPTSTDWAKWLTSFPSYGFLLSAPKENITEIAHLFNSYDLTCAVVGEIMAGSEVLLQLKQQQEIFWNLKDSLTGFNNARLWKTTI